MTATPTPAQLARGIAGQKGESAGRLAALRQVRASVAKWLAEIDAAIAREQINLDGFERMAREQAPAAEPGERLARRVVAAARAARAAWRGK